MQTKIISKRNVAKGKEKDFFERLKSLKKNAMNQEGFISGETLVSALNTKSVLFISEWKTLDAWKHWMENETRKELDSQLTELQENATEYEQYVYGKYRAAARKGFPIPLQGNKII